MLNTLKDSDSFAIKREIDIDQSNLKFDDRRLKLTVLDDVRDTKYLSSRHTGDEPNKYGFKDISKIYKYYLIQVSGRHTTVTRVVPDILTAIS